MLHCTAALVAPSLHVEPGSGGASGAERPCRHAWRFMCQMPRHQGLGSGAAGWAHLQPALLTCPGTRMTVPGKASGHIGLGDATVRYCALTLAPTENGSGGGNGGGGVLLKLYLYSVTAAICDMLLSCAVFGPVHSSPVHWERLYPVPVLCLHLLLL
ncbi:hypothetical protein F5884DRAFT_209637 [Xylogone sp. PMI_703]|nr:hypothetical protein F5884DRAFT_209637 [Xylogone sp. PMI_703]